jgi:hypothetical protein
MPSLSNVGKYFLYYLVCWQAMYILVNQDFNILMSFDYFFMAWTFSAGERPFFIWFFSIVIFLVVVLIMKIRKWYKNRYGKVT